MIKSNINISSNIYIRRHRDLYFDKQYIITNKTACHDECKSELFRVVMPKTSDFEAEQNVEQDLHADHHGGEHVRRKHHSHDQSEDRHGDGKGEVTL